MRLTKKQLNKIIESFLREARFEPVGKSLTQAAEMGNSGGDGTIRRPKNDTNIEEIKKSMSNWKSSKYGVSYVQYILILAKGKDSMDPATDLGDEGYHKGINNAIWGTKSTQLWNEVTKNSVIPSDFKQAITDIKEQHPDNSDLKEYVEEMIEVLET